METQQQGIDWLLESQDSLRITLPPASFVKRNLFFTCKRGMDIVLAGGLLLFLLPLLLTVAVLIKLDSPGPVIFRQKRLTSRRKASPDGETWRITTFTCWKFRSMHHGASADLHKAFVQAFMKNDQAGMSSLQNGQTGLCKLTHDPRITRMGKLIRKASIDELPQLWNVLKGDMSLVGPRPPLDYEVQSYEPWHRYRMAAKPGLTGWWQVNGRSAVAFDDMIKLDIWYTQHQSLWLDFKILMKTPRAVLSGRGAV